MQTYVTSQCWSLPPCCEPKSYAHSGIATGRHSLDRHVDLTNLLPCSGQWLSLSKLKTDTC